MMYMLGYAGKMVTREQFVASTLFRAMQPEFGRRVLAACDAANTAGAPLGIGGTIRSTEGAVRVAMSRHHPTTGTERGCCTWGGVRFALNRGVAHAAFPDRTYHVAMTPKAQPRYCLAVDTIGKAGWSWLRSHADEYGLRQFYDIGNEPWHLQPIEIPTGRQRYNADVHEPLPVFDLPGLPDPQAQRVEAPTPSLAMGRDNDRAEVREWQAACNFWKWRDGFGRQLLVDGGFGELTKQATMAAQKALGVDLSRGGAGVYGPQTAAKFQAFLDYMAAV